MATKTLNVRMQQLVKPDPDWQGKVLLSGELGFNNSDGSWAVGDGATQYQALKRQAWVTPGTIIMSGNKYGPLGFIKCDGRALSRTVYSDLYTQIGTTYGSGDGSTTFNIPNLDARFPMGLRALNPGSITGGRGEVVLTTSQIAKHDHMLFAHAFGWGSGGTVYSNNTQVAAGAAPGNNPMTRQGEWNKTDLSSGGSAHENIPPFTGVYFLIKY